MASYLELAHGIRQSHVLVTPATTHHAHACLSQQHSTVQQAQTNPQHSRLPKQIISHDQFCEAL